MFNQIVINGMYGEERGKSIDGRVTVQFTSRGTTEILSVEFAGRYRVEISFRPVESLIQSVRIQVRSSGQVEKTLEESIVLDGFYSDRSTRNLPGPVTVWFRCSGSFEMLTLAFRDLGQISIPFSAIAALISRERRNFI